jgi:hypothetical protein
MARLLEEARRQLSLANWIIACEGVLDAFAHVGMRHPDDPGRYLLARSRSPDGARGFRAWRYRAPPSSAE